ANDNGAVWFDEEGRAVGETDASAAACLGLHCVAGVELRVGVGRKHFACRGADDANVALEGNKPGAGWMVYNGDILERIAVFPDIEGGAGSADAQHENGDYQIDETL